MAARVSAKLSDGSTGLCLGKGVGQAAEAPVSADGTARCRWSCIREGAASFRYTTAIARVPGTMTHPRRMFYGL